MPRQLEDEKRLAAEAASELIEDGMSVGLGTGSTVAYLLPALARRHISLRCVATSPDTARRALELGINVVAFAGIERLDIAIDGADQIASDGWLVKGGGGAQTREKLVAATAERFVVIGDSTKPVDHVHPPIPLELLAFGLTSTLARLAPTTLRAVPPSPDGGVIADFNGPVGAPAALARRLDSTPGVIGHGLFAAELVDTVFVARGYSVEMTVLRAPH